MSNFASDVHDWGENVKKALTQIFQEVVIGIGDSVIYLTAVKTGRLRGNWQLTVDKDSDFSLINYDRDGGRTFNELVSGSSTLTAGQVAYITNNIVYGPQIEYNGVQNPQGMVRVTQERFLYLLNQAVKTVK